ncbi:ATP-binding protein [Membranihabitans maritimus]|uniref:ATP-binding protein n=1 Tax=Membranihabitans maritimus TaxID=2904244 RepID=UPI001F030DA0|nr:ATP-binding protein [Membranihabitans maritimus]
MAKIGNILRIFIVLLVVLSTEVQGYVQGVQVDSVYFDKKLRKLDSLTRIDFTRALELGKEIVSEAGENGLEEIEIRAKIGLARIYVIKGELDSAKILQREAFLGIDTLNDLREYADYLDLQGNINTMTGQTGLALENYQKAYTINKSLERKAPIVKELANIAAVLMHQEEYERSIPYIEEATKLAFDQGQWGNYASLLVNHAISLKHMQDTSAAYQKLKAAEKYVENTNIHLKYAFHANMVDFSGIYNRPGDMLIHAREMLEIAELMKSQEKIAYSYSGFSKYYSMIGNYGLSENYLVKAIDIYEEVEEKNRLVNLYESAAELYSKIGEYQKAFGFQGKGYSLKQEIQNENTKNRILELETNFELQRQKALNLEKELELSNTRNELESRTNWLYLSLGGFLISLVIGGLIISNYRRKKALQDRVLQQKEAEQKVLLLQEYSAGEEKERMRISRELHDNIGGLLAAAKLHISAMGTDTENGIIEPYGKISEIVEKAHQEARTISHRLAPIKLEQSGLDGALAYFCNLVSQKDQIEIIFESSGNIDALDSSDALVIYRAVQELVINAIKHAECDEILVQVFRHGSDCEVIVEDNGKGFDIKGVRTQGIGLQNIENQISLLNGIVNIDADEGLGTTISLFCPGLFKEEL